VGIVSGSSQKEAAKLVREQRLGFPVAVDPDGALFNLYRVGVCPSTVFAGSNGRVVKTVVTEMKDQRLRREVARLR
jgi:peroxiredoxin